MYRKKVKKWKKKLDTNMYVYFGSEHYDRELFKNDKNLNIPKFSLIGFSLKSKNGGHVKYCVETNNYLFNGHRSISNIK